MSLRTLVRTLLEVREVKLSPVPADVVLYGLASSQHLSPLLEKCKVGRVQIFDKYRTIYLLPILRALLSSRNNAEPVARTYINLVLEAFSPHLIITAIHNDFDFYRLVKSHPKLKFLVVQSGFVVDRPWSMKIDWDWVSRGNFENLIVWTWGSYFDYIFRRFSNASVVHTGSVESISWLSKGSPEASSFAKKSVLLVSQYRPSIRSGHQLTVNQFQARLARCVGQLATAQGLQFVVVGSRKKFGEKQREKWYFAKLLRGLDWEWKPRQISSSNLGKASGSLIGVGVDSSLLFQLAECGVQIAVAPKARPDFDCQPWEHFVSETEFSQTLVPGNSSVLRDQLRRVLALAVSLGKIPIQPKRLADESALISYLESAYQQACNT